YALAHYLKNPDRYLALSGFYQAKRDQFRDGLASSRLRLLSSQGTYFQCVDFSAVSSRDDAEFARWLVADIGVAAIPLSAFYRVPTSSPRGIVRFCFAKKGTTLSSAINKLLAV
ncbi:MAG: aminotransferase class I/II-fold pyridoxal phosphate-dependent enzyme, partial [Pseudomonadota bacterium]|nr:aminotransferase class I/II-fold pyridoxal phosphate-dependent enzyme [Pseudomonadota bacterium]